MRTIIAGGRTITDPRLVSAAVAHAGFEVSVVLSGAARGADRLGEEWAALRGIPVERYPADWNRHGRAAGPIRNREMIRHAEALLAIWDGASRGTADVIGAARQAGLQVYVYRTDRPDPTSVELPDELELAEAAELGRGSFAGIGAPVDVFPCFLRGAETHLGVRVVALGRYREDDALRAAVLRLKKPRPPARDVALVAGLVAGVIGTPSVLIPMPRRLPGGVSGLDLVTAEAARLNPAILDGAGILQRVLPPAGGAVVAKRMRFSVEAHAASMAVAKPIPKGRNVVLLDDVLTIGGTLGGAVLALRRDAAPSILNGLVLLAAGDWTCA
jgi:hypothetical protein